MARRPVEAWLLVVYLAWWLAWSLAPADRLTWFFENLLVFLVVPALVLTRAQFRFSTPSYAAIFSFLCLHTIGAHYGYANVPIQWEAWGFARNHTDRVVHLAFGLLAVVPVEDLLRRAARVPLGWREGLAVASTLAAGASFEIVEWLAVAVAGDAVGSRNGGYLGWQGDEFDSVKDTAMALLGAAIAMGGMTAARLARAYRASWD